MPARGRPQRTWPTAVTVLAGVIGDPVEHSLSPALHNAALVELGLDWAYVAFPVPAGSGEAAVAAMVDLGIRGLSVTMPHKAGAARACHQLSPVARTARGRQHRDQRGRPAGRGQHRRPRVPRLVDRAGLVAGREALPSPRRRWFGPRRRAGAGRGRGGAVEVVARRPERAAGGGRAGRRRSAPSPRWTRPTRRTWWSTPPRWGWTGVEGDGPVSFLSGSNRRGWGRPTGRRLDLRPGHDEPAGGGPVHEGPGRATAWACWSTRLRAS